MTSTNPNSTPSIGDPRIGSWFWLHVEAAESGCWIWTAHKSNSGYGYPYVAELGKHEYTHRIAFEAFVGPIATGLVIDHLCRNRACCNPQHLEAVTARENTLRSPLAIAAVNAVKARCKRGHEFTADNTYVSSRGSRYCRACRAQFQAEYRLRQREAVA